MDVQGASAIRDRAESDSELKRALVQVFLTPPSLAILEKRLQKRGTDSAAVIAKRLGVARQEIAQWRDFDYLIISTTITEDLRRMQAVFDAEKMRVGRLPRSKSEWPDGASGSGSLSASIGTTYREAVS